LPYAAGGLRSVGVVTAALVTGRPLSPREFDRDGGWIDYAGPRGTVPTVSFSDLVEGRTDPRLFRDRIVVVGATAPTLQDVHSTPTSTNRLMSGPEIQANAISTALRGLPLRDAPSWTGLLALLLLGAAPALAHLRTRGLKAAAVSPLLAVAYGLIAQGAFAAGWVVPVTYPLLALVLGTLSTMSAAFVYERRERNRVAEYNDLLERRVRERTVQLRDTQLEIVRRLGQAAESRDGDTGEHIERISRLAHRLALAIGLSEEDAELIGHASAMHDIGKIASRTASCSSPARSTPTSGRSCSRTRRSGPRSSPARAHPCCRWPRRSHARTTSAGTAGATRPGCAGRRSRSRQGSAPSATSSTPCSRRAATSRAGRSTARWPSCSSSAGATSTPHSWTRSS